MATNFPNSLDNLTNPNTSSQLNSPSHAAQHTNANDAIEALQAKVGVDGSAVVTSHDYKIAQLQAAVSAGVSGTKLIYQDVRNQSGSNLSIATPVYVTGSEGASGKLLISAASNASEATSSKTMGLTSSSITNNNNGQVVTEGILENIDTTGAADGDPVWLGVNGAKIYGLANKPSAPAHLVFLGIVVRGGQANTGSIYVKIQNGFELQELHNVSITSLANKDALVYDSTTQLWKNYDLTQDFVSSADVQNSLGDYIPLNTLGSASGPAELDPDGNLLVPENKIIIEGATADAHELTIQAPDVTSDITVTLPNATGTLALTSDISTAISNLVNSAPSTLDTLNELAIALGNDANFATTITTALGNKLDSSTAASTYLTQSNASSTYLTQTNASTTYAPLASPALTGTPTAPTATSGTNTTQVATTAFVKTEITNGVQTLTNKTISGSNNTLSNIGNASLTNSSITINGSPVSLGGSVSIQTGPTAQAVSSNITMAANNKYFVDTTVARTLTLPASSILGDEIQVFDASNLAGTNNVTINSNSGKINGSVQNAIIDVDGAAVSFVYTGSTYGWRIG